MSDRNTIIQNLRVDYSLKQFDEQDILSNPIEQFQLWFDEAIQAEVNEPNAMTLATIKPNGYPAARVVLLKGVSELGFTFFTNYQSNKGKELESNPHVSLVFTWLELQRQVRIEGKAFKISKEDSDAYFHSRPIGSQIGAHASPQSQPLANRQELERMFKEFEQLFNQKPIMRPEHWGGYLVEPHAIEFWQGRQNRLHDRFLFTKTQGNWAHTRLAP